MSSKIVVVEPEGKAGAAATLDTVARVIDSDASRHSNPKVVVLSSRTEIKAWGAALWAHGSNFDRLLKRLKSERATASEPDTRWIVVVDLLGQLPVNRAYNRLFRDPEVTLVVVSPLAEVAKDHRFGRRVQGDYVWLDAAKGEPVDPGTADADAAVEVEVEAAEAAPELPAVGWFGGWFG